MPNTKPSWGNSGIVEHSPLPEAVFGRILKNIDFDLSAEQEILLLGACERFIADLKIYPLPRRSNVRAAIEAIQKRLKRSGAGRLPSLLEMLRELDATTRIKIVTQDTRLNLRELTFQLQLSQDAIEGGLFDKNILDFQLEQLAIALDASLQSICKDSGGPTTDLAMKGLVERLAELYEASTGEKPCSGFRHDGESEDASGSIFFKLVETCLSILEHRLQSPAALGKFIERTLE